MKQPSYSVKHSMYGGSNIANMSMSRRNIRAPQENDSEDSEEEGAQSVAVTEQLK